MLNRSYICPVVLNGFRKLFASALIGQIALHLHAELCIVIIRIIVIAGDRQTGICIFLKDTAVSQSGKE